jgi:hypothetical protein
MPVDPVPLVYQFRIALLDPGAFDLDAVNRRLRRFRWP